MGRVELSLDGPREGNPYLDVELSARFTQGDRAIVVPGFWDGGGVYKVRFMPPTAGRMALRDDAEQPPGTERQDRRRSPPTAPRQTITARCRSSTPSICATPTARRITSSARPATPGCIRPSELQEQTLKTLAASPFNKIRFCVFPKAYAYNQNEPEFFAFQKQAGWQVRLQPARSGVLAAFRAADPRPAAAGHRGRPHSLAPLRPLGLRRHERRGGRPLPALLHCAAVGASATSGGRWPTSTIS